MYLVTCMSDTYVLKLTIHLEVDLFHLTVYYLQLVVFSLVVTMQKFLWWIECHIHSISESTFYRYQKHLLVPVSTGTNINKTIWKVIVDGDRKCDSSWKCAKYCSYTIINTETNLVVQTMKLNVNLPIWCCYKKQQ